MHLFNRSLLHPALLLSVLLGTSATAEAQRITLDWSVMAPRGFDEIGIQVIFGPTEEIELRLTLANDEEAMEWVALEPSVFEAIKIRMVEAKTEREVASAIRWREDARCSRNGALETCPLMLRTSLPPGGWMQPVAVLAPSAPGEYPEGEYRVDVDFTGTRPSLRGASDEPWSGRVRERGTLRLVVRAISSAGDRRQYYRIEGGAAMIQGDLQRAFELYELWMIEFPDEPQGHSGVGRVLLEQRRFDEAARMFERALALSQHGPGTLLVPLATAYISIGQEARAVEALQRYVPAADIPRMVQAARQEATRIRDARR
jgi:tetratricopeptide (TPR) repeat protein